MNWPRARTVRTASAKSNAPAATNAEYSPREWPATRSHRTPAAVKASKATILAVKNSVVPPTVNLEHPGEGCDLDYCPKVARDRKIRVGMSNSFGFGGHNACLVVRRWE
jgi:hypothetical protein